MKSVIILIHVGVANEKAVKNSIYKLEEEVKNSIDNKIEVLSVFMIKRLSVILEKRSGIKIEYFKDAMDRLTLEGYENIMIQPIYFMTGDEFKKLEELSEEYSNNVKTLQLGRPLIDNNLSEEILCEEIIDILLEDSPKNENILFIGHGSNIKESAYNVFNDLISKKLNRNLFLGTLIGEFTIDRILDVLKIKDIQQLRIIPLFMLVGKHVRDDVILSDTSWVNTLKGHNIEVECLEKGLLENTQIRKKFINKINLNNE
ncbi:MAG: sirohydrochlorin cobaltochelatase [Sarcina sp.]